MLARWADTAALAALIVALAGCTRDQDAVEWDSAGGEARPASTATDTGPPELPRVLVDTRLPAATGRRISVPRGGDLQRALDDARPGDILLLEAGAEFLGSFVLPKKDGSGWITIRTSVADEELPPEGTRVTPADAARMPKIITRDEDPALATAPGAHHYRLIGLEISAAPNVERNYGIVLLGGDSRRQRDRRDMPHHLVIDRSYIHGHAALSTRRCVALNAADAAVIDSYLADCHDRGFDSQAICGWNGAGPFKIVNNYLEGAGENVMFGGGDPGIGGLIPSDIEIRRNHFFKPLAWKGTWTVKNLFELKNARRVLVEGNVFENNWLDAQSGFALVFKSENQDGRAPWSVTRDVTLRYNRISNVASGIDIMGTGTNIDESANRILVQHNLFERVGAPELGGDGRLWQLIDDVSDITFDHNTGFARSAILMLDHLEKTFVVVHNNVLARGDFGIFGSGRGEGNRAIEYFLRGSTVSHNVIIGAPATEYPSGNHFPAAPNDVGFVDYQAGDYRLGRQSAFRTADAGGESVGADIDAITKATAGVVLR